MTAEELAKKLLELPEEQRKLPVYVYDYYCEISWVEHEQDFWKDGHTEILVIG